MYTAALICIAIVAIVYIVWGRKDKQTSAKTNHEESKPADRSSVSRDASMLYKAVHDRMRSGMTYDEFAAVAGDLATPVLFIELRQRYNNLQNSGVDASAVTERDYETAILKTQAAG